MDNKKTISVLNNLVEINNDRIQGYEKAAENTKERELIDLFSKFKATSKECLSELKGEIKKLDGEVAEGTNTSGKFFRAWMDVKSALTGKDRKTILESCENGEENALEAYNEALNKKLDHLNHQQQDMLKSHRKALQSDQSSIKTMKDALVVAH